MTAALTSVGVQYGSIAIGALAASNTATITAVGSGAYIIWMGQKYSTTVTDASLGLGRVELTNSTTVTATRGSSLDTNTLTVNFCVVDGDTTNLIQSVQAGTISLSAVQTSNTASISAVTNTNTATNYLGASTVTSLSQQFQSVASKLALVTTTVTCTRNSAAGSVVLITGFQCIEYKSAALAASVQSISQSNSSGTSNDTVITSVTTTTTAIAWAGHSNNTGTTGANAFQPYVRLKDATHTTVTTNVDPGGGTNISNYTVIPFASAMLTANGVQRGQPSLAAATSATLTITSVTQAQAQMNFLNNTTNVSTLSFETCFYLSALTNATTVTVSNTASVTGIGSVEVIEFNPIAATASASGFNYYYNTMIGRIDGIGGSI